MSHEAHLMDSDVSVNSLETYVSTRRTSALSVHMQRAIANSDEVQLEEEVKKPEFDHLDELILNQVYESSK